MVVRKVLNLLDSAIVVVILLSGFGFLMAKEGHAGVNKIIHGESKVAISVYFSGLKTSDVNLFKVGEKSAITIRNQPVEPPMTIVDVKHCQKQISFLSPDGKKVICYPDPAQALAHDFVVTVVDNAEVTGDGYVIRGNKIKVGNQIDLEGFKYRASGVVVDICPANEYTNSKQKL